MNNFIEELRWRGMIHDYMEGTEEQLAKEITTAYIGFDPSAPSLHIGNLAAIMLLKQLQLAGHKPIILIGGATGMIGDPSGKSAERNLLDEPTIRHNEQSIKEQLKNFLDFHCEGNPAEIVNNYDWFKDIHFLEFLRDVGKHISVNYMMAKDSVKNRLETGISFTEFSYQMLQGYDFYYLYKTKGVKLQMGGSDQWGNITTGTELIRRMAGGEAFALTNPLVTKADGSKFGKSEEGNVWLDPEFTSPYKFYQFWLNVADEDCSKLIRYFTLLSHEEIERLEEQHAREPHKRIMQKAMADEITERVHSKKDLELAKKASSILFGKSTTEDLQTLDESTLLNVFEGVPQVEINKNTLDNPGDMAGFLSEETGGKIFQSKGEARRMMKNGGVSINKTKISMDTQPGDFELLQGKYLLVQKGKKQYYLVKLN